MKLRVGCRRCRKHFPWSSQRDDVVVRCVRREFTGASMVRPYYRPQMLVAMYATLDRSRCWIEAYHHDGDDTKTTEICDHRFIVAAVRRAA